MNLFLLTRMYTGNTGEMHKCIFMSFPIVSTDWLEYRTLSIGDLRIVHKIAELKQI